MSIHEDNQLNEGQSNFGLPDGYFQRSANAIANKIEWGEEHRQFPELIKYKDAPGFTVPENYFVHKELQLELIDEPQLQALRKANPFRVPENYFEDSEITLLAHGLNDSTDDLQVFETLKAIPKQPVFKAPENYFAAKVEQVTAGLMPQKQARVIRLFSAKSIYAVAAILIAVLGFWIYSAYFVPVQSGDCGTIACLDKTDLVKTKTLENLDNEDLYELVNSGQLEEHLNTSTDEKTKTTTDDSSSKNDAIDDLPDGI